MRLRVSGVSATCTETKSLVRKTSSNETKSIPQSSFSGVSQQASSGLGTPGPEWHGLLAPSHTPEHIINTLNSVVQKAVMDPALQSQLLALGYTPQEGNESAKASGFKAMIWNDIDRFGALAYKIGLQVD